MWRAGQSALNQGMNTPASSSPTATDVSTSDHTRRWANLSGALFIPAVLVIGILTLATDQATTCVMYNECGPALPGWLFTWSIALTFTAWLVALAAPWVRVRRVAFIAQLLAECTTLVVIVSYT